MLLAQNFLPTKSKVLFLKIILNLFKREICDLFLITFYIINKIDK